MVVSSKKLGGRKVRYGLLSAASVLAAAQMASAATYTWLAAPATNIWNTTSVNWNNGANTAWADVSATPNSATFNAVSASQTVTLSGTIHVGTLTFVTGGWTLTGGTALTGGDSSALLTISNSAINTISGVIANNGTTPVTFSGTGTTTLTMTNTYSGLTTLSAGTVSIGSSANLGAGNIAFTGGMLQVTGTTLTTLDSRITNLSTFTGGFDIANAANIFTLGVNLSGSGTLTKAGAGKLVIGGTNTNTGVTTISGAGILQLGVAGNLGTGGLTFTTAGTFDMNGRNQSISALNSGAGGSVINFAASSTSTLTITGNGGNFNGIIQDGGLGKLVALTLASTATQTLAGINAYTGATTVSSGATTLTLATTGGSPSSAVNVGIGGTLVINSNLNVNQARTASVSLTNATLTMVGTASTTTSDSAGNLSLGSGQSTIAVNNGASATSTLNFGGLTRDGGGTVNFTSSGTIGTTALVKFSSPPAFIGSTSTTAGAANIGIIPYFSVAGTGFATYDSTVGIRPLGAGETSTATTPATLTAAAGNNVIATASIAAAGNESINSLNMNSTGMILSGSGVTLTVASGGIFMQKSGMISVSNLDFNGNQAMLWVNTNLTISGIIQNNGGLGLTKSGSGNLNLQGVNNYTGTTTINGGSALVLNSDDNLGGSANTGALVLNASGTVQTTATVNTTRGIVMNNGSESFQIDPGVITTLGGVISGVGALTKTQSGTLVLTQQNTYTGNTLVQLQNNTAGLAGGTMILKGNGGIGSSKTAVGVNSTLVADSTGNGTSATTRTGTLVLHGNGMLVVNGSSANDTLDNFGALKVSDGNDTPFQTNSGESFIVVNPGSGHTSKLSFLSMAQTQTTGAYGVLNVKGPNFGQTAGANVAQIFSGTAPTLLGGTGSVTGILPWLTVTDSASGVTSIGTYDATYGVRPLSTNTVAYTTATNDYNTGTATGGVLTSGNVRETAGTTTLTANGTINSLTLQGNGITLNDDGGARSLRVGNTNHSDVILSQGTGNTISVPTLSFGSNTTTAANTAIIYVDGDLTISSQITDGSVTPSATAGTAITKSGPGTLHLTGNNTFHTANGNNTDGVSRLLSGTLAFDDATNLGNSANTYLLYGGTLELTAGHSTTFAGTVQVGSTLSPNDPTKLFIQVDSGSVLTLSNPSIAISNTAATGFTKSGPGELKMTGGSGATNVIGVDYVAAGKLSFGSAGVLMVAGTLNTMPGTQVAIDSTASGTTAFKHLGFVSLAASSLDVTGGAGNTSDQIDTLNLRTGASTVTVTQGGSNTTLLTVTSGSSGARDGGATVLYRGNSLGTAASAVSQLKFTTAPSQIVNGIIPFALADTSASGNGIGFAANGANGITVAATTTGVIGDGTSATANRLIAGADSGTGTVNSLTLTGGDVNGAGTVTIASGGILSLSGTNTIESTTLAFGAKEAIFHTIVDLTVSAQVTGTAGLTKSSAGTLVLSNTTNNYTGTTWINGGTLSVAADTNLGAGANGVVLNKGGTLLITDNLTSARNVTVNAGGGTNISVASGRVAVLNGAIGGQTATTTILAQASTLGVTGTGTLQINGTASSTVTVNVTNGATLGGTGTLAGGLTVAGGGHVAPGASVGTLTAGTVTLANTSVLDYDFGAAGGTNPAHGAPGSSDRLNITGGAGSLAFPSGGTITLNLASGAGSMTTGSYELFSYTDAAAVLNFLATSGTVGSAPTTSGSILLGTGWASLSGATYDIVVDAGVKGVFLDITTAGGGGPVTASWIATTGTGLWSDSANWSGGVPNGAGSTANFTGTGTLGAVSVDGTKSAGTINFSGAVSYTLSGSAITLDNTGGSGNAAIASSSTVPQAISSQVIVANTNLNISSTGGSVLNLSGGIDNTVGNTIAVNTTSGSTVKVGASVNNGALALNGAGNVLVTGTVTGSGVTTVNGGTLGGTGTLGAVTAGSGAHTIAPSATLAATNVGTLTVGSLTTSGNTTLMFDLVDTATFDAIHVTGNLDVSGGGHILFNDNNAPEGYYKVLQYGSLTGNPLAMSVPTIVTSPANKEAYIIDTHHDAGFIDIHKALIGDANGDGIVDGADFDVWFTHLLSNTFSYESGDFDGSGLVDGADFDLWFTHLLNTFGGNATFGGFSDEQLSNMSQFLSPSQMASLPVPEPTSLAVLGLGVAGLLARRRRM